MNQKWMGFEDSNDFLFSKKAQVCSSSIEHGGTRPFSNIMAPLTLFNEAPKRKTVALLALKNAYLWLRWPSLMKGYETIFQYVVFLCYYTLVFLWGTSCGRGGFILFSLHMTMVWDLARGAGILTPSNAIDVCVSKHQSALIRGDGDSQLDRRAAGPRT